MDIYEQVANYLKNQDLDNESIKRINGNIAEIISVGVPEYKNLRFIVGEITNKPNSDDKDVTLILNSDDHSFAATFNRDGYTIKPTNPSVHTLSVSYRVKYAGSECKEIRRIAYQCGNDNVEVKASYYKGNNSKICNRELSISITDAIDGGLILKKTVSDEKSEETDKPMHVCLFLNYEDEKNDEIICDIRKPANLRVFADNCYEEYLKKEIKASYGQMESLRDDIEKVHKNFNIAKSCYWMMTDIGIIASVIGGAFIVLPLTLAMTTFATFIVELMPTTGKQMPIHSLIKLISTKRDINKEESRILSLKKRLRFITGRNAHNNEENCETAIINAPKKGNDLINISDIAKEMEKLNPQANIRLGNPKVDEAALYRIFSSIPMEQLELPEGFTFQNDAIVNNDTHVIFYVKQTEEIDEARMLPEGAYIVKNETPPKSMERLVKKAKLFGLRQLYYHAMTYSKGEDIKQKIKDFKAKQYYK